MSEVKTVTIKGQVYNLPPLTTGQVRRHAGPLIASIRALSASLTNGSSQLDVVANVPEIMGAHADLLHMALRNEYPSIELEDVETLHFSALQSAVADVLKLSGMMGDVNQGEVTAPAMKA